MNNNSINEIAWVAVPNGLKSPALASAQPTEALLRVLMVPRLSGTEIGEYRLGNWPDRLAEIVDENRIFVQTRIGNGQESPKVRPRAVSSANPDAWQGFFSGDARFINGFEAKMPPTTTVRPTYDYGTRAHLSYRNVSREVNKENAKPAEEIRRNLLDGSQPGWVGWAGEPDDPTPATSNLPAQFATPDFHATVAMLREHPRVLLELGLVFELTVNIADIKRGNPGDDVQISVGCDRDSVMKFPFLVSPWTRFDLDLPSKTFRPAPSAGSVAGIKNGLLDLNNSLNVSEMAAMRDQPPWAIATFDIDGAVGGLRQTARDLAKHQEVQPAMPPIRSAGLVLLRPNRQADYAARASSARTNTGLSLDRFVFSAEDLVLGYRVDIKRVGVGTWHSLCERESLYTVADGQPLGALGSSDGFVLEEGHVKPFAALKDANGGLYADDVVVRWDGWNLVLPKPNLAPTTTGLSTKRSDLVPYNFRFEYRVKAGRLPALRFASTYRMRIRIADLAGGGIAFKENDTEDKFQSIAVTYRRHEPVAPPRLTTVRKPIFGAADDRLVIRSDKDVTPAQLEATDSDYAARDIRIIDPPTTSLQLIEQHGGLDVRPEEAYRLVQRDLAAKEEGSGLPDWIVSGVNPRLRPDITDITSEPTDNEIDPWYPGGDSGDVWPDYTPKRIELMAAEDGADPVDTEWVDDPDPDPKLGLPKRTLQITLGKAKQAIVDLSSTIRDRTENHLAITDHFQTPRIGLALTTEGRNPVVTPPRRLLVVHAVKRPLADPEWQLPPTKVGRTLNDRTAVLTPSFVAVTDAVLQQNPNARGLNTDSTGRLTVSATWKEFQDVGSQAGPGGGDVTRDDLHSEAIALGSPPQMRILHDFGDTKHRRVTYTLKATSRFREYFKDSEPEKAFQAILTQAQVNILSSARPPDPVVIGVMPAFRWRREQPDPNRIEHTRSAQRLRVELARPWYVTGEGEKLAVVLATANNTPSARSDLITRIGRDPLFASNATGPRPQRNWFAGTTAATVKLPELNGETVTVIPIDAKPGGDRWFADVEFNVPANARSYNPFVQLAVARYQPDTVDGLFISRVVITEKVPLLPDRRVVAVRSGNQLTLTVEGTSPNPLNRLDVILERYSGLGAPEDVDLVVDDPAIEPQIPAWRPVAGGTVTRNDNGTIPPITLPSITGRLRVRLRESERLDGTATAPLDLVRRNVFVDTILLPLAWHQP